MGIDARGGRLRTAGWTEDAGIDYLDFARQMEDLGVTKLVFTDIDTDGTLSGPSFEGLQALQEAVDCDITASGGVSSNQDIAALHQMGLYGAIVGKAWYAGAVDLRGGHPGGRAPAVITKRIIPCLDVKDGRVVKGVNFLGLHDVSNPVDLARYYSDSGADELVFYDITASAEGRALFTDILVEVASTIFIPLTVGGGINTVEDFDRVLKCGADKVSVNSGALRDPSLIFAAAKKYGDQCVVLSVDAKRVAGQYRVFAKGGREDTGLDAIAWIKQGVRSGAGGDRPQQHRHRRGEGGALTSPCSPPCARAVNVPGDRLRRRRRDRRLCQTLPVPAQGGRGPCRLHLPLRPGRHPRPEAGPARPGHQRQTLNAEGFPTCFPSTT